MRLRSRKGVAIVFVVAIVISSGIIGTYYLVLAPTPSPFVAELHMLGRGTVNIYDNVTAPYENLSLSFTSPSALDPSSLIITLVCSPGCPAPTSAPNAGSSFGSLNLTYLPNTYPHWMTVQFGGYWSGYNAEATNPDGALVGGRLPATNPETSIQSGAILTVMFPPPSTYSATIQLISLTHAGHPGTTLVTLP